MDARLASYVSVTFVFAITPGATTAVVVRNVLAGGRRAGLLTAIGAAFGNASQAAAAGLGLSVLLRQWPPGFTLLRVAGALYLSWLGLRSLWRIRTRQMHVATVPDPNRPRPSGSDLRQGWVANLLNPSISTFYLAILPSFLPRVDAPGAFAGLAAIHIGLAFCCHLFWATAFDRLRVVFARPTFARGLEVATGLALLGLAWKAVL